MFPLVMSLVMSLILSLVHPLILSFGMLLVVFFCLMSLFMLHVFHCRVVSHILPLVLSLILSLVQSVLLSCLTKSLCPVRAQLLCQDSSCPAPSFAPCSVSDQILFLYFLTLTFQKNCYDLFS